MLIGEGQLLAVGLSGVLDETTSANTVPQFPSGSPPLSFAQRRYNCGGPGPATETGNALSIVEGRSRREEEPQGMANVDNGMSPGLGDQPGAPARTRAGKPAGPAFKPMHQERDPQEYAALLDAYDMSFRNMAEGEVVKGTVLKVTDTAVVVDVGYKSEGLIQINEFLDENGQVTVQAGDTVDVLLERTEDREGHIVLSREKAEKMKIWDEVEKAYTDRKVVIGRVIERIKGGLAVDIGVRAFLPGSQIDVRPVRNLDALRGQELRMRVIKVNKKRGNIVLSRKALLEEENAEKKKTTLETLAEGKVLRGTVKNITDYGAFIDLGGIDGLLHITDMSWGRVGHPSELFKVNDEVDVIVLKYDPATERVSLGHKQLVQDPWATVQDRYPVGARMSGKVVSLTDYGAFVELEPGVEGLIHVSEMSWSKRVKHPSKILNVGDSVEAMVLGVDPAARRISLGLKQVETNPWHELTEKYPVGTRIKGKVRNLTEFGAFVEVEEDIDGLIHISDMSWSKRIKHPSEVLKKGDVVEAMVLSIDAENQRLSLGLKQLATDIWDDFFSRHHVGDLIEGKVTRMTNFGAFVELDEGIEGLIHVSEFDEAHGQEKIDLQVGNSYQMKIIKLSPSERKIGLSIRALKSDDYRADWETYSETSGTGTATLGDHFRNR
jgi:small subunit ribosomal protein S1